jgi:hypothetical protein
LKGGKLVNINEDRLITQSVTGEITHPMQGRSPYKVSAEGEPEVLPGTGGITFNARVGDSAIDWEADHVEPGASFSHMHDKAGRRKRNNYAFNVLSCIGNEAELISGEAEGKNGVVVGKHGGIEHVMVDFPEDVLSDLRVGDQIQVKARGVGLELEDLDTVEAINVSPELIEAMDLIIDDDALKVPVTHRIPAKIMGSGLGADNTNRGDYDIQMFDDDVVEEHDLDELRFGDVVAIGNADHSYGRIFRSGAVTIGVVVHSRSIISGHGPGVTTLFTSSEGNITPLEDESANLKSILELDDRYEEDEEENDDEDE